MRSRKGSYPYWQAPTETARLPLRWDPTIAYSPHQPIFSLSGRNAAASTGQLPQLQQGRSRRRGFVRSARLDIGQSELRVVATVQESAARPELAAALRFGLFDKQILQAHSLTKVNRTIRALRSALVMSS